MSLPMEDVSKEEKTGKKRVRDDSDLDSVEEKRVDSDESELELNLPEAKRVGTDSVVLKSFEFNRVDSAESELNSFESNRIPEDILEILDEPDTVTDSDSAIPNLDSFIKSFEDEILHPSPPHQTPALQVFLEEHGEPQPDLGYLLEASDDELGLPPTFSPSNEQTIAKIAYSDSAAVASDAAALTDTFGFEDDLPEYNSFGIGIGEDFRENDGSELVAVGGLFDCDPADFSEFLYRPGSLHAV
ncbi:hypothetical protein U1Q18_005007 [Sarracenia purpurea var. burkii]